MPKLIIPKNPKDIGSCTPMALMRLRVSDTPVIGMIFKPAMHIMPHLIYVGKDGLLKEMFPIRADEVSFIDYLTDQESITIFGEAGERTDDDIAPEFSSGIEIVVPPVGSTDFNGIPDWTVFEVSNARRGPLWVVMGPSANDPTLRRAIYVGRTSKTHMTSFPESDMEMRGDRFERMGDSAELARFNNHPDLRWFAGHPFPI